MTMKVDIGGVWKDISGIKVNIDGVWKSANKLVNNIGGVWKSAWDSVGKYELLGDITLSASATTVDITGLNISAGEEILLVSDMINSGTAGSLYLFVNGNTTVSNYYSQRFDIESSTKTAARYNIPYITGLVASTRNIDFIKIRMNQQGYFTYQDETIRRYGSSTIEWAQYFGSSTFTISSITQLTITADASNAIYTGSRFRIYKIGG